MRRFSLVAILPALALGACAEQPLYRTNGPSTSNGVTVALVGQRCGRRYNDPVNDVLGLQMLVQVSNSSAQPITVIPSNFRLLVDGEAKAPALTSTQIVEPGGTKVIEVQFRKRGDTTCKASMRLSLDHAVDVGTQEVGLPVLSFVPSSSDV